MVDTSLVDLLAEGHAALDAPPIARVSNALTVLPRLVEALDRVALYQTELRDVRMQLTEAVKVFREAVWSAQKQHPEVTYKSAQVQKALGDVNVLLDRLDRLIFTQ